MAINKNSNLYTFGFAFAIVIIVGTLLAIASNGLKELQEKNSNDKKMISILGAINVEANRSNAKELYDRYVINSEIISGKNINADAFKINIKKEFRDKNIQITDRNYPLYECKKEGNTYFVIPVVGTGLWGPIWGFISLNSNFKSIYGATFNHKTETPGLGAEINQAFFSDQYSGEFISDSSGIFKPIIVVKDGSGNGINSKVDGITGGTITSKGVEEMTNRTLEVYVNYFNSL